MRQIDTSEILDLDEMRAKAAKRDEHLPSGMRHAHTAALDALAKIPRPTPQKDAAE